MANAFESTQEDYKRIKLANLSMNLSDSQSKAEIKFGIHVF
jgi:hypothetical protein